MRQRTRPEHHRDSEPARPAQAPEPGAREAQLAREPHAVIRALKLLGPGLIAGVSDDDPATVGTYAVIGAQFGFATLWTQLVTVPLMAAVQFIAAKIGLVTGEGLAGVVRRHYPRWLVSVVVLGLLLANILNAGADIGAIAAGAGLLLPVPASWLIAPVALAILALQFWGSFRFVERTFKWLSLVLCAYVGASLLAKPDVADVLKHTFVPEVHFDRRFVTALVAIAGTTFSPYLYFWQAGAEVEEKVSTGRRLRGTSSRELKYAAGDVDTGMIASNVVTYFIILATGATLFKAGKTSIQSATEAAQALRPLAGDAASMLFALGFIGAGILAVPVLTTSAAYAVSEVFGWRRGLDERPGRAKPFYTAIAVATLVGMLLNVVGINPFAALFWTSLLYGFLAPPLMVLLMLLSNNRGIMGERVNGTGINVLGWLAVAVTVAAAVGLIVTWGQSL